MIRIDLDPSIAGEQGDRMDQVIADNGGEIPFEVVVIQPSDELNFRQPARGLQPGRRVLHLQHEGVAAMHGYAVPVRGMPGGRPR